MISLIMFNIVITSKKCFFTSTTFNRINVIMSTFCIFEISVTSQMNSFNVFFQILSQNQDNLLRSIDNKKLLKDRKFQFVYIYSLLSNEQFIRKQNGMYKYFEVSRIIQISFPIGIFL